MQSANVIREYYRFLAQPPSPTDTVKSIRIAIAVFNFARFVNLIVGHQKRFTSNPDPRSEIIAIASDFNIQLASTY